MELLFFITIHLLTLNLKGQETLLESGLYAWEKHIVKQSEGRESRQVLEGATSHFEYLEIHATTQYKGAIPRPPHAQKDLEELILVKDGTMMFTLNDQVAILGPGSAILIPPLATQALENIGDGNLTYFVLMFRSKLPMDMDRSKSSGGALFVNAHDLNFVTDSRGGHIDYFRRPTAMNASLDLHLTRLDKNITNKDQQNLIDSEIILVMDGNPEVSLNDQNYNGSSGDLFLFKSNEMHTIHNSQDNPCKYFSIGWK